MARRATIQLKVHGKVVQSIPQDIECLIDGLRQVTPCTQRIDRLLGLLEQIRDRDQQSIGMDAATVEARAIRSIGQQGDLFLRPGTTILSLKVQTRSIIGYEAVLQITDGGASHEG